MLLKLIVIAVMLPVYKGAVKIRYRLNRKKRTKYLETSDLSQLSLKELDAYVEKVRYDAEAFEKIGQYRFERKEYDKALRAIEFAIAVGYGNKTYRRFAGDIAFEAGDYKKALKHYRGSLGRGGGTYDYDYFIKVGQVYMLLKEYKKATSNFTLAKRIIGKKLKDDADKSRILTNKVDGLLGQMDAVKR